jgi:hypothetical protein
MLRRSHKVGEHRRSRSGRARRYGGGTVIAGSAAGALWALGMSSATAPQAHADFEDLIIQPVIDAVSQAFSAVDPGLLSSLDSSLDLSGLSTHTLADVAGSAQATGSLPVVGGTEPIADVSVNGGAETPVLVDTGSDGLVIPIEDIGFQSLSFPTSFGLGSYSGGLDYFYLTFDMPVTIDGVTADGPVDVALFEFPTTLGGVNSFSDLLGGGFNELTGGAGQGILGIGPDSVGPGPGIITNDLPTGDSGGVLINEPGNQITFDSTNPDPAVTTLSGAPISDVYVSVDHGPLTPVTADFDSGGVNGAIPESALSGSKVAGDTSLPAGTEIQVYAPAADGGPGALLYEYDTGATNTPTVVSSGDFDTGAEPFLQGPIYVDTNGTGETVFDYSAT